MESRISSLRRVRLEVLSLQPTAPSGSVYETLKRLYQLDGEARDQLNALYGDPVGAAGWYMRAPSSAIKPGQMVAVLCEGRIIVKKCLEQRQKLAAKNAKSRFFK
jgi:hypothetical protein